MVYWDDYDDVRKAKKRFLVDADGSQGLTIDSVNGVSPTSLSDLYDKLIALIS